MTTPPPYDGDDEHSKANGGTHMSVKGDTVPVSYHGSTYVCAEYEPSVRDAEPYDEDVDYFKLKYMKRIFFVTILMTFLTSTCLGLISIFSMDDITEFEIIYDDLMERKFTGFVVVGGFGVVSSLLGAFALAFGFDFLVWPMILSYGLTAVFVLFYLGQEAEELGPIDSEGILNDQRLTYFLWQLPYFFFPVGILGSVATYWVAIRDTLGEYDTFIRQMYIVINFFGILLSVMLIAHFAIFQSIDFDDDDTGASTSILYAEIVCGGFAFVLYLLALFGARFFEWMPWLSPVASLSIFTFYLATLCILQVEEPADLMAAVTDDFLLYDGATNAIIVQYAVRMLYALTYAAIGYIIKRNW